MGIKGSKAFVNEQIERDNAKEYETFVTHAQLTEAIAGVEAGTPDNLATVATTGDYADLTGTPTLAPVATSGSYDDLTGTPELGSAAGADSGAFATAAQGAKADTALQPGGLATVATTGAYTDLTGKPTLATVAGTGAYSDLVGRPALGTAAATSADSYATAAQGIKADSAVQPGSLAAVATSGAYSSLSGKPTLGTAAATAITDYATAAQGTKADEALPRDDTTDSYPRVYVVATDGEQVMTTVRASAAAADSIVSRDSSGQVYVPVTPTADGHSASKKYVDDTAAAVAAGISPGVIVLQTGDEVPAETPVGTVIVWYTPVGPLTPVVSADGYQINTATSEGAVTTGAAIPVGDIILCCYGQGTGTGTHGSQAITLSAGAVDSWRNSSAGRASTVECGVIWGKVTTEIPAGATVTFASPGNTNFRVLSTVISLHNVSTATPDATSGDDADGVAYNVSAGANASASTLTASTDAATTVPDTIVFGIFAHSSAQVYSLNSGTEVYKIVTAAGSSDRALLVGYKVVTATGVQSMTATAASSTGICGCVIALPITIG